MEPTNKEVEATHFVNFQLNPISVDVKNQKFCEEPSCQCLIIRFIYMVPDL